MEKFSLSSTAQNAEPSQDTAPKEISLELPKELLEKVLEKTVDIEDYGTAFSVVGQYNPDEIKDEQEKKRSEIESWKLNYEDFKKEITENDGRMSIGYKGFIRIPLIKDCQTKDGTYKTYCGLKDGLNKEFHIQDQELDRLGLDLENPVSKAVFDQKYDELLEKQFTEGYEEYLRILEERITGESFETYREDWREDEEEARRKSGEYIKFYKDKDYYVDKFYEGYQRLLKKQNNTEERSGDDEDDEEYYYNRSYGQEAEYTIGKLGFDIEHLQDISKEEFTERYNEVLKRQDEELELEVKKDYENYRASYDEGKYKEKSLRPFASIFGHGIFGGRRWRSAQPNFFGIQQEDDHQSHVHVQTPEAYVKDIREKDPIEQKKKERHVFFNIVGEFHNQDMGHRFDVLNEAGREWLYKMKMRDSYFFKEHGRDTPIDTVAVVFDKKGMTAFSDDPKGGVPRSEHGYAGPARVAPRKFLGVVVQCTDKIKVVGEDGYEKETEVLSTDPGKWERCAEDIARTLLQVDETHPDRLIPIYDAYGNMLWPTKMSHEEIQNKLKEKTIPSA